MKKIYISLLVALGVVCLSGCGNEGQSAVKQEINTSNESASPEQTQTEELQGNSEEDAEVETELLGQEFLDAISLDTPAFVVVDTETGKCTILENGQEWKLEKKEDIFDYCPENYERASFMEYPYVLPESHLGYNNNFEPSLYSIGTISSRETFALPFLDGEGNSFQLVCTLVPDAPSAETPYFRNNNIEILADYQKPLSTFGSIYGPEYNIETVKMIKESGQWYDYTYIAQAFAFMYSNVIEYETESLQEWKDAASKIKQLDLEFYAESEGLSYEDYMVQFHSDANPLEEAEKMAYDYYQRERVCDAILEVEGIDYSDALETEFFEGGGSEIFKRSEEEFYQSAYNKFFVLDVKEYKVGKILSDYMTSE